MMDFPGLKSSTILQIIGTISSHEYMGPDGGFIVLNELEM
jgi:hypothetical protein